MNERIRELAEQAGITTNLDTEYFEKDMNKWVDYFSEKFAELIVRECVAEIESQYGGGRELDDGSHSLDWDAAIECAAAFVRTNFGISK